MHTWSGVITWKLSGTRVQIRMIAMRQTMATYVSQDALIPVVLVDFFSEEYFLPLFRSVIARATYLTCSNVTAEDYYMRRQMAELDLFARARESLQDTFNETITALLPAKPQPVSLTQLQITNIEFPTAFNDVNSAKLQATVQQTASLNNRATQLTNANTQLIVTQQQANIVRINGNQQATVITATANATQLSVVDSWRQQALEAQAVRIQLLPTATDEQFVAYWRSELERVTPKTILLN
jgi:hypothetical protein